MNDELCERLLPLPSQYETEGTEYFVLKAQQPVVFSPGCESEARQLADYLQTGLGISAQLESHVPGTNLPRGAMCLEIEQDRVPGAEGYTLTVSAEAVRLCGQSATGVFRGIQTLLQLFPSQIHAPKGATWNSPRHPADFPQLPACKIVDVPRFAHRGLMLDVARSFLSVAEVCAIVEHASRYKLNVLHLHLVDDQGWRLEITNEGRAAQDTIDYTQLTQVSGQTAVAEGGYGYEPGRTGFYTQQEYREILEFCRARHIEVIPEIDVPGHTGAALAAIPQLCTPGSSHTATPQQPTAPIDYSTAVGRSYLDPHSEQTLVFLRHVLRQVVQLDARGSKIHLGGDEPHAMIARYGRRSDGPYAQLVQQAKEIVRSLGRQPVGWNEYLNAGSQDGDVVQYWYADDVGQQAVTQAARAGAQVILSPGNTTYLDQKYDSSSPIGLTWAGAFDVPAARDWDPEAVIAGLPADSILGVEAPLWSETVRGQQQAEWLIFPRLLATAEVGWSVCPQAAESFLHRCALQGPRLAAGGVNFFPTPAVPWN